MKDMMAAFKKNLLVCHTETALFATAVDPNDLER